MYIIYLHAIEVCLKITIAVFCFCYSKNPLNIMKNIFNGFSIYFWKKKFLVNKYKRQMCKKKINLCFLTSWKMAKFFLQKFVIFNMITDSFLLEKRAALERAKRYVCKNLLNLDCQDSIHFGIFQVSYQWRIISEDFLYPILSKMFW